MVDKNLDIKQIQNIESFDILKKICEENNFFKYFNKFFLENFNLKKIKNFLIACIEEQNYSTNLTSLPYKLIVDPTNACNLGCPLCPTGLGASERKKGILKFGDFKRIVDESKDYCIELHLYNWGEPTLNKDLIKMINYAHQNNIWTRISSNMSLKYKDNYLEDLVTSGLNLLHIDIDGLDQEVYEKYRKKGNLKTVLNNLEEIIKIKKDKSLNKPVLEVAMLAMRMNINIMNLEKKKNVDVVKIDKIQHNPNMDEKWLPTNKDLIYKTYEGGTASSNSAKDNESKQCHWPWSSMVINYDGGVNPCCIIDDPNSDFANFKSSSIKDIWNNKEYISSRSEFADKSEITKKTICNVCKNTSMLWQVN